MKHSATIATQLPFLMELGNMTPNEFVSYYTTNRMQITSELHVHGAIKFDGIHIDSSETFQRIVDSISDKFMGYVDGTSPRTQLTDHVYTSTEYNKSLKITMHNELSYSAKWPGKLYFSCLLPSETGGETLLADSRKILGAMDPSIVSEIESRGIVYIRNLHGGDGVGMSWQQAFETIDKRKMESICDAYNIEYKWKENDAVQLRQKSKGIITHPVTGERVWFNQIDQFHPHQLGKEVYEALMAMYDSNDELPTYVSFADGEEISREIVVDILATIDKLTVYPAWKKNQLLMVDNVLASHGRNWYTGDRKVVVAMTE